MTRTFPPLIKPDPLRTWIRNATVQAIAYLEDETTEEVATRLYGHEGGGEVQKAAVNPASTDGWGSQLAAGVRVAAFLKSLRPRSAAAQLIDRGLRLNLEGVGSASLPGLSSAFPEPAWVAEGAPIPAFKGALGSVAITPKKLAAISGLTGELSELSAEDAEAVVEAVMIDAAAKALDGSIFSNTAASALRPAGILNGVSALSATAGGGLNAFLGDLQALVGAIHAAGGGSDVVLVAAPQQAVAAKILGGAGFDTPVITAPNLAAGTVIAVEAQAFASGFSDVPRVDIAKEATIHWEDTTPAQIGTAGSPNVVAAPTRSGFQTNTHALRLILRAAWGMRAPMVAWVSGTTW
jgi:hypothetical protein